MRFGQFVAFLCFLTSTIAFNPEGLFFSDKFNELSSSCVSTYLAGLFHVGC